MPSDHPPDARTPDPASSSLVRVFTAASITAFEELCQDACRPPVSRMSRKSGPSAGLGDGRDHTSSNSLRGGFDPGVPTAGPGGAGRAVYSE